MRSFLFGRSVLGYGVRGFVLAQVVTLVAISLVGRARKRRRGHAHDLSLSPSVAVDVHELRLFTHGEPLFDAMLAAIDVAQHTILLETFIWKDDATGQSFKDRLIAKAEAGVAVYVIYDGFGNLVVPRAFKTFPPSIHALEYHGWERPWHILDPRRYARDHRKVLVVDGDVAFIGGYNIGDAYRTEWRDTHLSVRGPAASRIGQDVIDFWNDHCDEHAHIALSMRRGLSAHLSIRRNNAVRLLFPIRDMYVEAIDGAEDRVWITTAYFVPDTTLVSALLRAAERGVDVRVLLPWLSNHVLADWLARGLFDSLLARGVRIFGYQESMIHAKTMVVDGIWCTVGTANLDRLSQVGNHEINLEIFSPDLAAQMQTAFLHDLSHAFPITREWWEGRPWYARGAEIILAPLRPLV